MLPAYRLQVRFVCIVALVGCGYHAGSFATLASPFAGTQITLGCIDLAVAHSSDPQATGPVVDYEFGNRCEHRVMFDLSAARVVARTGAGVEVALAAYDPQREISPLPLPALGTGHEWIEYEGVGPQTPICVDVGGTVPDAAAGVRWICPESR